MNKNDISLNRQHALEIERLERLEALFLKCSKAVFAFGALLAAILLAVIVVNVINSQFQRNGSISEFSSVYVIEKNSVTVGDGH